MKERRGVWAALAVATVAAGSGAGFADTPKPPPEPPPDEELLEFLGTVDSTADPNKPDDSRWIEYLSQTDIDKAAKQAHAPGDPDAKAGAPKVKPDG